MESYVRQKLRESSDKIKELVTYMSNYASNELENAEAKLIEAEDKLDSAQNDADELKDEIENLKEELENTPNPSKEFVQYLIDAVGENSKETFRLIELGLFDKARDLLFKR
jgi:chromosome segregation ATPase